MLSGFADADREALSALGIVVAETLPSELTVRRTLAGLGADDVAAHRGVMLTQLRSVAEQRVTAIGGKSLRAAGDGTALPHLLAAVEHEHSVALAQPSVPNKSSKIPPQRKSLASIHLAGAVVTADALHCQRASAALTTGAQGGTRC